MNRLTFTFKALATCLGLSAILGLAGCSTVATPKDVVRGKGYQPQNVFVDGTVLPKNIRRVVVLPLVCDENNAQLTEGTTTLQPVVVSELMKTKKFEVVSADAAFLKNRTSRAQWSGEEVLPPDLFAILRENSACDAVLFSRLTVFRAYPPLAVGWRLRLVDAVTGKTLWAADEVFNGGEVAVSDGARRHQLTEERNPYGAPDEWFIQNSPSKFGEYTAARLFATLPSR